MCSLQERAPSFVLQNFIDAIPSNYRFNTPLAKTLSKEFNNSTPLVCISRDSSILSTLKEVAICAVGSGGCELEPLPSHVIYPLNYNQMNGKEMRLLNPEFEGTEWTIPN